MNKIILFKTRSGIFNVGDFVAQPLYTDRTKVAIGHIISVNYFMFNKKYKHEEDVYFFINEMKIDKIY